MLKVGIVGASGYAGQELVEILLRHPKITISSLAAKIDKEEPISGIFPNFLGRIDMICKNLNVDEVCAKSDFIFLALPHKVSMEVTGQFLKSGKKVVDLSADYRLKDVAVYKKWYGVDHTDKENIAKAIYGLPELYKDQIKKSEFIANPGCYPTGSILGVAPLLSNGFAKYDSIIIDAKSGVSGAGRTAVLALNFCEINESFKAYKVNQHQHKPEIDQILTDVAGKKINVIFVPHLVPMSRGILSTIYLRLTKKTDTKDVVAIYKKFYKGQPFVRVLGEGIFPGTKNVTRTNFCDIGIKVQGDLAIVITAIDNLVKGASGQAIQNMNIMSGFKETEGLV